MQEQSIIKCKNIHSKLSGICLSALRPALHLAITLSLFWLSSILKQLILMLISVSYSHRLQLIKNVPAEKHQSVHMSFKSFRDCAASTSAAVSKNNAIAILGP